MKFIIICATGRSGSTTLQRLINTIDECNITGEKFGAIENLLECYNNIKKTNKIIPRDKNHKFTIKELEKKKIKPAWYNCYNFNEVKKNIKQTILSILVNKDSITDYKILGFKEIRWFGKINLLDDFIELFPKTKIICHLDDNVNRQCKSNWWSKNSVESKKLLIKYNQMLINYSLSKDNCYLSYLKNLFIVSEVKKIFLFLDEKFDEEKYKLIIKNSLEN